MPITYATAAPALDRTPSPLQFLDYDLLDDFNMETSAVPLRFVDEMDDEKFNINPSGQSSGFKWYLH